MAQTLIILLSLLSLSLNVPTTYLTTAEMGKRNFNSENFIYIYLYIYMYIFFFKLHVSLLTNWPFAIYIYVV